jgi:hypothetical protein
LVSTALLPVPNPHKYVYTAKFICATGGAPVLASGIGLAPGNYWTDINVHNPSYQKVNASITQKFVAAYPSMPYLPPVLPYVLVSMKLGPDAAMRLDCSSNPIVPGPLIPVKGFVMLYSNIKLDVVAEYTAESPSGDISLDTQYIQSQTFIQ